MVITDVQTNKLCGKICTKTFLKKIRVILAMSQIPYILARES